MHKVFCQICKIEFETSRRKIHCSPACRKISLSNIAKRGYKNRKVEHICKSCKSPFHGTKSERICCSCKGFRSKCIRPTKNITIECRKCPTVLSIKETIDFGQKSIKKSKLVCYNCKEFARKQTSIRLKLNNPNPRTGFGKKIIRKSKEELRLNARQRMLLNNPMFKSNVKEKMMKSKQELVKTGKLVYKHGARHHLWKGNRNRAQTIRTRLYKYWNKPILERDGYACCLCGKKGGRLEVHHVSSPFRELLKDCLNGKNLSLISESEFETIITQMIEKHKTVTGITYCKPCHKKVDVYRK